MSRVRISSPAPFFQQNFPAFAVFCLPSSVGNVLFLLILFFGIRYASFPVSGHLQEGEMEKSAGYYKGYLERNGFKKSFAVFALSDEHAIRKVLHDAAAYLPGAVIHEIEGPCHGVQV
jgi:hypothetical protein